MNNQQINAVATADAHLKNAGLPTYSETLQALKGIKEARDSVAQGSAEMFSAMILGSAIVSRIPA